MNKIKTYIAGSAILAILFFAGSLMQSRQSQAKGGYSSPVTVFNTATNPVQGVDIERLARIPYQSSVGAFACGPVSNSGARTCAWNFTPAPSGFRLVVENVGGFLQLGGTNVANPVGVLQDSVSNSLATGITAAVGQADVSGEPEASISQPTLAYFDSTQFPQVLLTGFFAPVGIGTKTLVLTGYLEDCSKTNCPPVQH